MKTLILLSLLIVGCATSTEAPATRTFSFDGSWWALDTVWPRNGKLHPDTMNLYLSNANGVLSANFLDRSTSQITKWSDTFYAVTWQHMPTTEVTMYLNCWPDSIEGQVLNGGLYRFHRR